MFVFHFPYRHGGTISVEAKPLIHLQIAKISSLLVEGQLSVDLSHTTILIKAMERED